MLLGFLQDRLIFFCLGLLSSDDDELEELEDCRRLLTAPDGVTTEEALEVMEVRDLVAILEISGLIGGGAGEVEGTCSVLEWSPLELELELRLLRVRVIRGKSEASGGDGTSELAEVDDAADDALTTIRRGTPLTYAGILE